VGFHVIIIVPCPILGVAMLLAVPPKCVVLTIVDAEREREKEMDG
jgi:hypothetical protein